jgi:heme-degrading monooxygenase HmoA
MSILVTMKVVDWEKFKAASGRFRNDSPKGLHASRTYRKQDETSQVLVVEEWDSHEAMHAYQEKVGDEFNRLAGTEGMHWEVALWSLADEMKPSS